MERIAIIGGGPGGLMLARLLQLRGVSPVVFERDAHASERPQGGSLDLHDGTGQRAIRMAKLEAEFAAAARPEDQGDRLYDIDGTLLYDRDGMGDDRPEIDRMVLRQILLDALAPETVRWNSRIVGIAPQRQGYRVEGEGWHEHFDLVVGADGAWSRVRPLLSDAAPTYEGVAFAELSFDTNSHTDIDALTGSGKMFAVGDNRALITQRNGCGRIRGYAGMRMPEAEATAWQQLSHDQLRTALRKVFAGWASSLTKVVETGDIIAVRTLYALPIGHRWTSRPGLTLLGDAAHLMSPFAGEGVNLALADAVDLADAITGGRDWPAIVACEAAIAARAEEAAEASAQGLNAAFSPNGARPVLAHYRERDAGPPDSTLKLSA